MVENEWRMENCGDYGMLYCNDCPVPENECPGAWTCSMVKEGAYDVYTYYDTNGDGVLNPEDEMDMEHYEVMVANCDSNYDGTLEICEIHECIVVVENEWRAENCPYYGDIYCPCEYNPTCEGAWNCVDIYEITEAGMNEFDTNGDG